MSFGGGIPPAGPGGVYSYQGELWSGDPRIAPGLPRPVGWRVREPDGSAAYDKFGTGDEDWVPVGTADIVGAVDSINGQVGAVNLATQVPGQKVTTPAPGTVLLSGGGLAAADSVNTTGAKLSALNASTFPIGNTFAWVKTVGAPFQLQTSALPVDHITVENASGLAGAQWVRVPWPNPVFWAISTWHVDPVNGSDEATGTGTGANALKTNAEFERRMIGATVTFVTLVWDNDIPDGDTLNVTFAGSFLTVQGAEAVVATQTITSAQARNAATNLANEITVTGFNFSPHVGQLLRVQGTTQYAAIVKAPSLGVARLGETTDGTTLVAGGITSGVVEIVQTRKGPLVLNATGAISVFAEDVAFDGGGAVAINQSANGPQWIWERVILGGTSANTNLFAGVQLYGGLIKSPTALMTPCESVGLAHTGTLVTFEVFNGLTGYAKYRNATFQGTAIIVGSCILHLDGDLGQFDLPASAVGIEVGGGTNEGGTLHFNSGRHYGSGNDATANFWSVAFGSYVAYVAAQPPTNNAGHGVAINGGNVAIGSLPVNLSLTNGSAVYAL